MGCAAFYLLRGRDIASRMWFLDPEFACDHALLVRFARRRRIRGVIPSTVEQNEASLTSYYLICKVSLLCRALYAKCHYYLLLIMQNVLIMPCFICKREPATPPHKETVRRRFGSTAPGLESHAVHVTSYITGELCSQIPNTWSA